MLFELLLMAAGANGKGGPDTSFFVMLGAMLLVMYFFMIRPQSKKAKEQKDFSASLQKGSKIVTIGGIHGKILKVDGETLLIEVDSNTKLRIERSAVSLENTQALLKRAEGGSTSES